MGRSGVWASSDDSSRMALTMPGHWDDARIGPRSTDSSYTAPLDLVDPAEGARVPRCKVCGMPDMAGGRLIAGVWTVGTYRLRLILCEREIPAFDPRSGDPLAAA